MAQPDRGDRDDDLRRLVAALPPEGGCLDEATWERLALRELTPFERERAFDHIVTCATCRSIHQSLHTLEDDARAFDPAVPAAAQPATRTSTSASTRLPSWIGLASAAAGVFVAAILGFAIGRNTSPSGAPELNVSLVTLEPDAVRGESGPATIERASGASATVVLNTTDDRTYSDYELRMLDARQSVVWTARGLHKSAFNTFTLSLPTARLAAGDYRLELTGLSGDARGPAQTFRIRLVDRPGR